MQDFIGRQLEIGDCVALIHPWFKRLLIAKVVKFSATGSQVYVEYDKGRKQKRQEGNQVLKLDGPDFTAYLLRN